MRFGLVAMAALSAAIASPTLAADWTGFYAGIYAGVSVRNDSDTKAVLLFGQFGEDGGIETPSAVTNVGGIDPTVFDLLTEAINMVSYVPGGEAAAFIVSGQTGYAPGPTLGAVTGYSFGNGVRVEADWSVSQFQVTSIAIDDIRSQLISGGYVNPPDTWQWTLDQDIPGGGGGSYDLSDMSLQSTVAFVLADVWYDLDNDTVFTPYLGGGLGLATVNSTLFLGGDAAGSTTAWVPAAQIGAGVTVDLNETSFLDVGYRLKAAAAGSSSSSDLQFLSSSQFIGFSVAQGGPVLVQTLQASLNIRFN